MNDPDNCVPVNAQGVAVRASFPATHTCPFREEKDEGTVTVEWMVGDQTLELHALREHLDGLDEWEVSHEEYTLHLWTEIRSLGFNGVRVTSRWDTAGGMIEVRMG
jgi:NADPH-dependent 7-cyano-7-deazaguanine reductase QueF